MRKNVHRIIVFTTLLSTTAYAQRNPAQQKLKTLASTWAVALTGEQPKPRQTGRRAQMKGRSVQKVWAEDGSFSVELPIDYQPISTNPNLFVAQSDRREGFYFIKSEHVVPEALAQAGPIPDLLASSLKASESPYYSPVDVIRVMLPKTRLPEGSIEDVRVLKVHAFDAPLSGGFGPQSEIAVVHFQCSWSSRRFQGTAVVQTTPPAVMGVWSLVMAMVSAPVELFEANWPVHERIIISLWPGENGAQAPSLPRPPGLNTTRSSDSREVDPYAPGMGRRTDTLGGQIVFYDPQDPNYAATYPLASAPAHASWWRCNEESTVTVWTRSGSPGISCRQVFPR